MQQSNFVDLNIVREVDPGGIVFTRGFSHDSKYYGGWTNYCRAIDRTAQIHDDIEGNDHTYRHHVRDR